MTDVLLIDQDSLFQQAFAKMIDGNRSCRLVGVAENEVEAKAYFPTGIRILYSVM